MLEPRRPRRADDATLSRMMPPHLRPVLLELEARVSRRFAGRRCEVRVSGSYARGEAHENSDVDVLVLVDGHGAVQGRTGTRLRDRSRARRRAPMTAPALLDALAFVAKATACLQDRARLASDPGPGG